MPGEITSPLSICDWIRATAFASCKNLPDTVLYNNGFDQSMFRLGVTSENFSVLNNTGDIIGFTINSIGSVATLIANYAIYLREYWRKHADSTEYREQLNSTGLANGVKQAATIAALYKAYVAAMSFAASLQQMGIQSYRALAGASTVPAIAISACNLAIAFDGESRNSANGLLGRYISPKTARRIADLVAAGATIPNSTVIFQSLNFLFHHIDHTQDASTSTPQWKDYLLLIPSGLLLLPFTLNWGLYASDKLYRSLIGKQAQVSIQTTTTEDAGLITGEIGMFSQRKRKAIRQKTEFSTSVRGIGSGSSLLALILGLSFQQGLSLDNWGNLGLVALGTAILAYGYYRFQRAVQGKSRSVSSPSATNV